MGYLSKEELDKIGFAHIGENVLISDKVAIHNPTKIAIGSHVRIDDFALLSAGEGGIEIGNYIHIACYACLIGHGKITLNDLSGLSVKATILSSTSDFSGKMLPALFGFEKVKEKIGEFMNDSSKPVCLESISIIGAHSVVMPGVTIKIGTKVGAMSVVHEDLNAFGIYMGNPARFVRKADKRLLKILRKRYKKSFDAAMKKQGYKDPDIFFEEENE